MQEEIKEKVLDIVSKKFNKTIKDCNEPLLGHNINFTPVELAIFLKELEKDFTIYFQQEDIILGRFTDIENIVLLIQKEREKS
ncbi:hypothetical protein C8E03_11188 [Lachnotalea glycerini]|jgi:hypothetical protein|uniref:Acyl carrier protein n=1 Tax=Lachnotalea glycerini TaxID=1763509 RepID=A0A255I729_9FIRM|nr:hypothetical protein [Lachnotalea glycerini]PXV86888.1 hypothetical protein C8E03_11188 [Lachnotalea glycerini]RDY30456.1 hypothetical protein CG710_014760 [Lachnotalea glycerini]